MTNPRSATNLCYYKTYTVSDLRNHCKGLLRGVSGGEEVLITRRSKVIARLSLESAKTAQVVDWACSPEVLIDRSGEYVLSAEQLTAIFEGVCGK